MWEEETEEIEVEDRLDGNDAWELAFEQGEKAARRGPDRAALLPETGSRSRKCVGSSP